MHKAVKLAQVQTEVKVEGKVAACPVESLAAEYKQLKNEIEAIEQRVQYIRMQLLEAVKTAPEGKIVAGPFKVMLIKQTRESVSVKELREFFGDKIAGFVKLTQVESLRIS